MNRARHLEPVAAYDQIAPTFADLSARCQPYLSAIEALILSRIPPGSRSLLDVGSGDGVRAIRLARAAAIEHLVLLEPSAGLRNYWPAGVEGWAMRAEDLAQVTETFDVITCLWNVLGHIFPAPARVEVLHHCGRLLSPNGRLFVDLNHRYNALHYGYGATALRFLQDYLHPNGANGDVTVRWNLHGTTYATAGHVFTHGEFLRLAQHAGLVIEETVTVDYRTGKLHRSRYAGNQLYVLRRNSSSVARTLEQTSSTWSRSSELKNGSANVLDATPSVTGKG